MWKAAAAVKDELREGLASGGEIFLEKSFSPEPHFPKAFDWWGGRAEGVRSDMRGTFMGGLQVGFIYGTLRTGMR